MTSLTAGKTDALKAKYKDGKKKGKIMVHLCHPARLCQREREREGKTQKREGEKKANLKAERRESAWLRNCRGRKQIRAKGRRCWRVAAASGVVEIFQQCASLLLSDVHLILQILGTSRRPPEEQWAPQNTHGRQRSYVRTEHLSYFTTDQADLQTLP